MCGLADAEEIILWFMNLKTVNYSKKRLNFDFFFFTFSYIYYNYNLLADSILEIPVIIKRLNEEYN